MRFGVVSVSRAVLWKWDININTFHLYIICRDGVLLLEEGSRTFSIMPSLVDEEEDTLVKSLDRDCDTNYWSLLQDSVCPILQVISSIPSCKLIEETSERIFSMHFDYCTTASIDFVMLDESSFSNILQVIIISSLYMIKLWRVLGFFVLNLDSLVGVDVCKGGYLLRTSTSAV